LPKSLTFFTFFAFSLYHFINLGVWYKRAFLNIYWPLALFWSLLSMQIWWEICQLLLRPLTKFGGKVRKIFWIQPYSLGQISYHFISFANKIFHPAQILQLPSSTWGIFFSKQISYIESVIAFAKVFDSLQIFNYLLFFLNLLSMV